MPLLASWGLLNTSAWDNTSAGWKITACQKSNPRIWLVQLLQLEFYSTATQDWGLQCKVYRSEHGLFWIHKILKLSHLKSHRPVSSHMPLLTRYHYSLLECENCSTWYLCTSERHHQLVVKVSTYLSETLWSSTYPWEASWIVQTVPRGIYVPLICIMKWSRYLRTSQWHYEALRTPKRHHESFKLFLIFSKLHHQQSAECRVERCATMHVHHWRLHVVDAQEWKMIALRTPTNCVCVGLVLVRWQKKTNSDTIQILSRIYITCAIKCHSKSSTKLRCQNREYNPNAGSKFVTCASKLLSCNVHEEEQEQKLGHKKFLLPEWDATESWCCICDMVWTVNRT